MSDDNNVVDLGSLRPVRRKPGPAPTVTPETSAASKRRDRMVRYFVKTRGKEQLRRFLHLCEINHSGQKIAEEFGVTRQRVQQWRLAFGVTITAYKIHQDVLQIADNDTGEEE